MQYLSVSRETKITKPQSFLPGYHFTSMREEWKHSKTKNKTTPSKLNKILTENRNWLENKPYFLGIKKQTLELSVLMFKNYLKEL